MFHVGNHSTIDILLKYIDHLQHAPTAKSFAALFQVALHILAELCRHMLQDMDQCLVALCHHATGVCVATSQDMCMYDPCMLHAGSIQTSANQQDLWHV